MKAKYGLLLFITLAASFPGYAVKDSNAYSKGNFIAINGGLGVPLGSFGTGLSTKGSLFNGNGYALSGDVLNITTGILLHNNAGIAGSAGYNNNGFDMATFIKNTPGAISVPNQNDQWKTIHLMGGLFLTFPVNRLSFDIRFLIGAYYTSTPALSYSVKPVAPATNNEYWTIKSNNALSFSSGLGAGIRLNIAGHLSLRADVDIYASPLEFDPDYQHTDSSGNVTSGTNSYAMDILLLNITVGIGYSF